MLLKGTTEYFFFFFLLSCITSGLEFTLLPSPQSLPNSLFPRSTSHPLYLLSEKKSGLPGTLTKHSITSYSKTRHIASHQGWMRQPRRRKRFPQIYNRVRDSLCSHQGFHKNTKLHVEDLDETPPVSLISVSPHEFQLIL